MHNDLTSMFGWAEAAGIASAYKDDARLDEHLRAVLSEIAGITGRQAVRLAEVIREY